MKRLILIGCFFLAAKAFAAIDPLSSQFMPTVDTNPSDYNTTFGTITVTTTSYRVEQSSVAPGNIHWALPFQFENEIHSFQIHATPSVNITSYTVAVSSLTNAQNSVTIATSNITPYREWYINVATPTALSTVTYSGGARGWFPHQLIPAVDPYYHQATNAFPVSISSGNTQSVWIDVYVPSTTPSGYYSGQALVSSGSVVVSTIPIVIGVWAWVMPSSTTLQMVGSGFGYNGFNNVAFGQTVDNCNYRGVTPGAGNCDGANTYEWLDGSVQMLDNKWGIDSPYYGTSPGANGFSTYLSQIGPLLNGKTANTSTILPGAALGIIDLQDGFNATDWQQWVSTFAIQGWSPRLFNYAVDEPAGAEWPPAVSSMTANRTYSTPSVPNLVTCKMADAITNNATNYIDWMTPIIEDLSPTSGDLRSTYNTWLATTTSYNVPRRIGSYDDCESAGTCGQGTIGPINLIPYPNYHIDGTAVANRAFQTALFKEAVSYELYYAVDECDNTSGGYPCAGGGPDPWHVVYAFGNQGPGTMMTPSTGTIVLTSTGTQLANPIWCPTITLKYHRDGMDDYEMENYLTNIGSGTFVNNQIATWYTNPYTFSNDPSKIEAARTAMGTAIHQITFPPGGVASGPTEAWTGKISVTGKVTAQ